MEYHPYYRSTCFGRPPLLEADLQWGPPILDNDLPWETLLIRRRRVMGDQPYRRPTMGDHPY